MADGLDGAEEGELKTALWLEGYLRQLTLKGQNYYIVHRGDADRGTIALKLVRLKDKACRILTQARTPEGEKGWMPALQGQVQGDEGGWGREAEADAYVQRLTARDPDVWVVEIETPDGTHPFPGREWS